MMLSENSQLGHYRILKRVGAGGMGEVYLACDERLDRQVAIKVMQPGYLDDADRLERFRREAKTAAKISHPGVMAIHDIGSVTDEQSGRELTYIVMEYVGGDSLTGVLAAAQSGIAERLRIAERIAAGLAAAHKLGIVHRDIKSDNIRFDEQGEPKILDFGLAKPVTEPTADKHASRTETVSAQLTQEGKILGTTSFMSPEQARGEPVDSRSDVFSFGILLYKMFTGDMPFEGPDRVSIMARILEARQVPARQKNEGIPPELERIIDKCLQKDPGDRYQDTRDLVVDVRNLRRQVDSGISDSGSISYGGMLTGAKRRIFIGRSIKAAVGALLVVAVLIIAFLTLPGDDESAGAHAAENILAVMYFDNLADPADTARWGEIAANLVITDLSESQYIQVVSSQRLHDILHRMDQQGQQKVDKRVALEVAQRARAQWMLMGTILQVAPQIIMTTQLVEVTTGKVLASQRLTGQEGETIFSLVDRLTARVKGDLPLSGQARAEFDPPVGDISTTSAKAYQYYLEGVDYERKLMKERAANSFRQALLLDSTFAMAYYGLAYSLPSPALQREAIRSAVRHISHANSLDQQYILARQAELDGLLRDAIHHLRLVLHEYPEEKPAYLLMGNVYARLGDNGMSAAMYLKVIDIDPTYKDAYNSLAYRFEAMGELEKSIWAIGKYIELAPTEPNPYDSRGDLYAFGGKIELAIESYRKALELDPGFTTSIEKLGNMYLYIGEYAHADSLFRVMTTDQSSYTRATGRLAMARSALYRGELDDALRKLDDGVEADRAELGESVFSVLKVLQRVITFNHLERFDSATAEFERGMQLISGLASSNYFAVSMMTQGAFACASLGETVRAEEYLAQIEERTAEERFRYLPASALVDLARGSYEAAAEKFALVEEAESSFAVRFYLARCYLAAGRLADAVQMFERALVRYDESRALSSLEAARIHYWLGLAYEKSGWKDEAIDQYEVFLDIWKQADPGLETVEDARRRLDRLQSGS